MTTTMTSLACPPRYSTRRNPDRQTIGPAIAKVSENLRAPFMPWQRHVADIAGEINPRTGQLQYRTIIITVPRQQGKTTLVLALAVHRAIGFGRRQRITYTAQTGVDAREKWQDDWLPILQESKYARWYKPRLTNGHEAVLWSERGHKSVQDLMAGTKKAGHGKTRDLGFIDEAGYIYIRGRKKFLINVGGFKVDPEEVENLLSKHPDVVEAAVLGITDKLGNERVKAVIVSRRHMDVKDVLGFLRGRIAEYKLPALVEFRTELPRSPAGKILRERLK